MNKLILLKVAACCLWVTAQAQNIEDMTWHGGLSFGVSTGEIGEGIQWTAPLIFSAQLSKIVSRNAEVGGSVGTTLNSVNRGESIKARNFSLLFRRFRYEKFGSLAPIGRFWGMELEYNDWLYTPSAHVGSHGTVTFSSRDHDFVMPYFLFGYQGIFAKRLAFTATFKIGTYPLKIDDPSDGIESNTIFWSKLASLEYALGYTF